MAKYVYSFGGGAAEGGADMRALLGGKGANLAEMSRLGLPVPPGFTIAAEVCAAFHDGAGAYPDGLAEQAAAALRAVEREAGARFGDPDNPLLLSVRSGARASMPGMLDTVLNLGLNDATAEGLARRSGDPRFAGDSYRRFIQMFGDVVLGVDHGAFAEILERRKDERGAELDTELDAEDWRAVADAYREKIREAVGAPFPQDPERQLWAAIGAVFGSWRNKRAETWRRLNGIPDDWGTAVTVQAMVFGNMGDDCASGVAFTRDPSTGARAAFGEFLPNTQGEDVVAGIRTPQPLESLEEAMPEAWAALMDAMARLEGALPRHAGRRVHRPARPALRAPDPRRQADRCGGAQDRRGHGGRRTDRPPRGGPPHRPGGAGGAVAPGAGPGGRAPRHRARPRRLAGRGERTAGAHRRRGGGAGPRRRERHPRPDRDQPRGHPTGCTRRPASSPRAAA